MSNEIVNNRIADAAIYDNLDFFDYPKEYFELIINRVKAHKQPPASLIDVGSANGAFLHHVGTAFPDCKLSGIEPVASLAELARANLPRAEIFQAPLGDGVPSQLRAEIVTCMGVIGIFQDPDFFLRQIVSLLSDHGVGYILSPFNEEPIDVILNYRHAPSGEWESGHNLFSMRTMEDISRKLSVSVEWESFELGHPIAKTDDPMRSWTEPFRENPHHVFYGTNMLVTLKLLTIRRKG